MSSPTQTLRLRFGINPNVPTLSPKQIFTSPTSSSTSSDNQSDMDFITISDIEKSPAQKLSKILLLFCRGLKNRAVSLLLSLNSKEFHYVYEAINIDNLFSDKPEPLDDINIVELLVRSIEKLQEHTDDKIRYLEKCLLNYPVNKTIRKEHSIIILRQVRRQLTTFIHDVDEIDIVHKIILLIRTLELKLKQISVKHK